MSRRVLVVDDDRSMVRTLADVLRLTGWEVATAYTGAAAVELAATQSFDVVLMDVKMPGMDGVTAFRSMKSAQPGVRVVLMTAYAARDVLAEAELEGVMRVVSKPVDVASLLTLLTSVLSRRRPVLLIDNDVAFLNTLAEILRLRGYDTVVALSLEEATRLIAEREPAAVLLHMHLPSATAREAVSAVHAVVHGAALILYSGQPGALEEVVEAIPAEWVHAYLQKPFAIEQVTGALSAIHDS